MDFYTLLALHFPVMKGSMLLNAEVETWLRASSNTSLCGPTDTEANSNLLTPLHSG